MIVIKFGRWNYASLKRFTYERIYTNTGKWTPFCIMRKNRNALMDIVALTVFIVTMFGKVCSLEGLSAGSMQDSEVQNA